MRMPEPTDKEKMEEGLRNWRGGREEDFVVLQHPERGRCVITTRDIPCTSFVMEYEGVFTTREHANRWEKVYAQEHYGCYIIDAIWEEREVSIDGTQKYGTIGRLVNHAGQRPNLKPFRLLPVVPNQPPRLALYAARNIKKHEELFWDYGPRTKKFEWGTFKCPRQPYQDFARYFTLSSFTMWKTVGIGFFKCLYGLLQI